MRPASRGIMCCNALRIPQNTLCKFQVTSSIHSSSVIIATGAVFSTPPELSTMMSSLPNFSIAKSTMPSQSFWLRASPAKNARFGPPPISFIAVAPFSAERPLITTCAPSRKYASAIARPMLRVLPVIAATFPSSFPMMSGPLRSIRSCRVV